MTSEQAREFFRLVRPRTPPPSDGGSSEDDMDDIDDIDGMYDEVSDDGNDGDHDIPSTAIPHPLSTAHVTWPREALGNRVYAAGTPYATDSAAIYCMLLMNQVFTRLEQDRLFVSPLTGDVPRLIVDLCTGVGTWAINVSALFQQATVYATDVCNIQPQRTPDNLRFLIEDVNEEQWFPAPNSVDLIHMRDCTAAVEDWADALDNAFVCLKAGGFFEMAFFLPGFTFEDNSGHSIDYIWRFWSRAICAGEPHTEKELAPDRLREAGFEVLLHACQSVPIGRWADGRFTNVSSDLATIFYDRIDALHNRYQPDINAGWQGRMQNSCQGVSVKYVRIVLRKPNPDNL